MQIEAIDHLGRLMALLGMAEQAESVIWRAQFVFLLSVLMAAGVDILLRLLRRTVAVRTRSGADDLVLDELRGPLSLTVVLAGTWYALAPLQLPGQATRVLGSVLATLGILWWTRCLTRLGHHLLEFLAKGGRRYTVVEPRTMPLLDIVAKGLVLGGCAYSLLIAWHIDVTAWLASAGVLGIAIGFAAQQTLSNVLAGVVIIADAPFKLGDFLVLDNGTRGRVTDIGMRSTRLLTQDNVEIIVPNSVMAGATITNESGGGDEGERLSVPVSVAYGTDIDRVRAVLTEVAMRTEGVLHEDPRRLPRVHLRQMGESSLDFILLVWIRRPEDRWDVTDAVNVNVYKRLRDEGIEIPYPKRDVYLHAAPGGEPEQMSHGLPGSSTRLP